MVQFECPMVRNPFISFTFGDFPFFHFPPLLLRPFLSLRLGKKVGKLHSKISLTGYKWSSLNAPRSQTTWCHLFFKSSLSHFLALLLPSLLSLHYKEMVYFGCLGKKVEIFWNKISLTVCKWSSLNAPWSETPVYNSFLESSRVPFSARVG